MQLYLSSCRESDKFDENMDEKQFNDFCKLEWKNMPEKDKVCWIKAAQEEEEQFRVKNSIIVFILFCISLFEYKGMIQLISFMSQHLLSTIT